MTADGGARGPGGRGATDWKTLARLVSYPDANTATDAAAAGPVFDAIAAMPLGCLQEQYTADFDFDPACSLNVGWHLFGESRERGAFLALLREDLGRAGIAESAELPDHLSHVLALVDRDEPSRAAELAAIVLPAVAAIEQALTARRSPYAHLLHHVYTELSALAEHAVATG